MIQETRYGGITAVPSDYDAPDGDLVQSFNLINENGALRPVLAPASKTMIPSGARVLCLHRVSSRCFFILLSGSSPAVITALPEESSAQTQSLSIDDTVISATPIGNILVLAGTAALHYLYCRDGVYTLLGDSLPELNLQFGLRGHLVSSRYDGALEFTDADAIENTEWDMIASRNIGGTVIPENKPSPDITMPGIALEAGLEYKLELDFPYNETNMLMCDVRLHGVPSSGTDAVVIGGMTHSVSGQETLTLKATDAFTGLYVTIRPYTLAFLDSAERVSPALTVPSGAVSLSKGKMEKADTLPSRIIKYSSQACNALAAAVNSFLAAEATEKNRFIYPFFVRAALRLFDGSIASVTPPCLLIPNSDYVPYIFYREKNPELGLCAFSAELGWRIRSEIPPQWRDIISAVEIYVSQPVWPYNQGAEYDPAKRLISYAAPGSLSSYGVLAIGDDAPFRRHTLMEACNSGFPTSAYLPHIVRFAGRSPSEIGDAMESTAQFYLFHTLSLSDQGIPVSQAYEFPDIKSGTLASLITRTPLPDETLPYRSFAGAGIFAYNQRAAIFGASYRLPEPPAPSRLCGTLDAAGKTSIRVAVTVATPDGEKTALSREYTGDTSSLSHMPWYFYPDSRARRAEMFVTSERSLLGNKITSSHTITLSLKEHPLLNGAYWICPSNEDTPPARRVSSLSIPPDNSIVPAPSSIYLSETSNPFAFRASLVSSVPAARVDALSTAARPLSQGQFGAFPLYAFTSEGIWALEISSTGTIAARQPITRDTCTDPAAITQIDSAVLFPSTRGIMLISGSQTQCISEILEDTTLFDISSLPGLPSLFHPGLVPARRCPFTVYREKCRMVYDYISQRVTVFNPGMPYAYVFSLRSRMWSVTESTLTGSFASYPDALAVADTPMGRAIVDLARTGNADTPTTATLLVSRPLKLGAPDVLKTIDTVIQRGHFQKGHVQSVLYGSRDLVCWHLVWSSKDHYLRGFRGSPYKYFRIVLLCDLAPDESISGASVRFTPRLTDQPR